MRAHMEPVAWWRSLYLRIGVSFVLLAIGIALLQGFIVSIKAQRDARDPRRAPHAVSMDVARACAAELERADTCDLRRIRAERHPDWALMDVVMSDGTIVSASPTPLPEAVVAHARQMLPPTPREERLTTGTNTAFLTAPIQVEGQLRGLVVLRFPPRTLFGELARLVSPSGLLLLVTGTALASWIIFTPARRKLSVLASTAERMREGDLQARAPAEGGDEIAVVARAFNRMGDELAERDRALKTADRLRRQMLADVSHELKTPLTAMLGFIETVQMPEIAADADRRARYFGTLARETRRLDRIVADLLDVARLENGVADFEMGVFATDKLFQHVAHRHEPIAAEHGVAIDVKVDEAADQICGDPHRLEQAVDNLVANALRHAPDGGRVTMTASRDGDAVALSVADTGHGIDPEHLPHVFDRFYKADPSRAATREGSGLGLSIVRAIVERHGGTVTVASQPGQTTFTIRLPQGEE